MTDSKATIKTPEQLQAETQELIQELEKPEETEEVEDAAETEEVQDEVVSEPKEEVEQEPEETEEAEAEPSPDYKKKFSESSREAQKIHARNRRLNQGIEEASEIPEPTEDELKAEYPDYDIATDIERIALKESLHSKKWRLKISEARNEAKKIEKWSEDVSTFIEDPKTLIANPELEGKTNDFIEFANRDANNSVPFELLVNAFLYEKTKTAKPKSKGAMFPDGSGGPNEKPRPKNDKITVDESEKIRKTDYKKYKELLRAGKIETGID